MRVEFSFDQLPTEVLLVIFGYCHARDLAKLSEVCNKFHDIINNDDILWNSRKHLPLVTNQVSQGFRDRCNNILCIRKRWPVSDNWQWGRYAKADRIFSRDKLMPWLVLTSEVLWWSDGTGLYAFARRKDRDAFHGYFDERDELFSRCMKYNHREITKFVVRDDFVISGDTEGGIRFSSRIRNASEDFRIDAHTATVHSVDEVPNAIISGSADRTVKIWHRPRDANDVKTYVGNVEIGDRVWSVMANPLGNNCAIGSAGNNGVRPLRIIDIENSREAYTMIYGWKRGAGIVDMSWEDNNILLTCGYDTYIRKWDIRSGTQVHSWPDPMDDGVFCMSSDHSYTIVTGAKYHAKACLWDQRMDNPIQIYYLNGDKSLSSPLYSLAIDNSKLFAGTDTKLIELSFSGNKYTKEMNFSKFLFMSGNNTVPAAKDVR